MNVFTTRKSLNEALASLKEAKKSVGFVPTMGALHEGHLALVKRALGESDIVVVSIFVNPTQFNNMQDLDKYPRMLQADVELLNTIGEVLVFAPSVDEVYPENDAYTPLELDGIDKVMEGEFRPGHFQGVVHVVRNLFQIVQPDQAYFGLKDFQQVAVIRLLTKKYNFPIQIIACPTLREPNGLAMSSRNLRLTEKERDDALIIIQTLKYIQSLKATKTPKEAKELAMEYFSNGKLRLEYLEIVNGANLKSLDNEWDDYTVVCLAAFCGAVRLIDNLELV
ncbi:MAG: pantoate--beta-alanine ligase [Crocinitomicaceae bacterium]|nr:MAG: pantoate--beta-alanine ligase [Crocinitomicaceae bacterium]